MLVALLVATEAYVEVSRDFGQFVGIVERHTLANCRERCQAIQGAAIQQVVPKGLRNAPGDRPFTGAAGPVNGDNRNRVAHGADCTLIFMPSVPIR